MDNIFSRYFVERRERIKLCQRDGCALLAAALVAALVVASSTYDQLWRNLAAFAIILSLLGLVAFTYLCEIWHRRLDREEGIVPTMADAEE